MKRFVLAIGVLLGLVLMIGTPAKAEAQCGYYTFCDTAFHKVPCCSIFAGWDGIHEDCRLCGEPPPAVCHDGCPFGFNEDSERKAYLVAKNAADSRDVEALLKVGPATGGRVRFSALRNAIQIMSCDRQEVIANINVNLRTIANSVALRTLLASTASTGLLQWNGSGSIILASTP